jgi:hypothetical protein
MVFSFSKYNMSIYYVKKTKKRAAVGYYSNRMNAEEELEKLRVECELEDIDTDDDGFSFADLKIE